MVQCLVRKKIAKKEYRRRKKEKEDVDALQAKIKAFEVRISRVVDGEKEGEGGAMCRAWLSGG